jgi:hypothetical protein
MLCLAFAPLAVINQRTILNETGVRIFTNDTLVALGFNCLRPCQLLPVEKTKVFSFAGLPWPFCDMLVTDHDSHLSRHSITSLVTQMRQPPTFFPGGTMPDSIQRKNVELLTPVICRWSLSLKRCGGLLTYLRCSILGIALLLTTRLRLIVLGVDLRGGHTEKRLTVCGGCVK